MRGPGRLRTRACGKGAITPVDKKGAMFDEAEDEGSTKVSEARGTAMNSGVFHEVEDGAVAKVTTLCRVVFRFICALMLDPELDVG